MGRCPTLIIIAFHTPFPNDTPWHATHSTTHHMPTRDSDRAPPCLYTWTDTDNIPRNTAWGGYHMRIHDCPVERTVSLKTLLSTTGDMYVVHLPPFQLLLLIRSGRPPSPYIYMMKGSSFYIPAFCNGCWGVTWNTLRVRVAWQYIHVISCTLYIKYISPNVLF